MNVDAWIEAASHGRAPRLPPADRNRATLVAINAAAMTLLRQDLSRAGNLARLAMRFSKGLGDQVEIGRAERLHGHVQLLSGRPRLAVARYSAARERFAESPAERNTTAIGMLQALAYLGEYDQSFAVAREAQEYFASVGDRLRRAKVEVNLGNTLHRLDRLGESRACYASALETLREVGTDEDVAIVMRNFSVCLTAMEEWGVAETMFAESRDRFELSGHRLLVLEIDLNVAYLRARQGRIRDALLLARSVREQLSEQSDEVGYEIGHVLLDQADVLLEAGLWSDAELSATEALAIFRRLGLRFETGKALLFLGWARVRRGHPDLQTLREARRILARGANQNWAALLWLVWSEAVPDEAGSALQRALATGADRTERTLHIQRAWAMYSQDPSAAADLPMDHPLDFAILARVRRDPALSRHSLALFDQMRRNLGPSVLRHGARVANAKVLSVALELLEDPQERLAVVQRQKHQVLAELLASPETPPENPMLESNREGLAEWRIRSLATDFLLSEVLPEPDPSFAELFIDPTDRTKALVGTHEHDLGPVSEWISEARFLRLHLSRGLRDSKHSGADRSLDRIRERLTPLGSVYHVGRCWPLAGLPIHAALPVTYCPSLGVFQALTQRDRTSGEGVAILGHADGLAPQIDAELEAVSRLLGNEPHVPMAQARLIHLAAHGVHREDQPLFSAMRLGDRDLTAFDLLQSPLRADLVVLSGCSTGLASAEDGAEVEGFVEALLAAGARSVIASLWDVDDRITRDWMVAFYSSLQDGSSARDAYRLAVDETRRRHPHPAHWAAFAFFGAV